MGGYQTTNTLGLSSNVIAGRSAYISTSNTSELSGTVISPTPINRVEISGKTYGISMDEDAFAEAMKKYMEKHEPKFYKLTCQGCGASINQKMNDHILKCPYCKSVYAVGTKMINARA